MLKDKVHTVHEVVGKRIFEEDTIRAVIETTLATCANHFTII
jgi:hypothetical protein